MREPTLSSYINRIKFYKKCMITHPEMKGKLEKKIKQTERFILNFIYERYDGGNFDECR